MALKISNTSETVSLRLDRLCIKMEKGSEIRKTLHAPELTHDF